MSQDDFNTMLTLFAALVTITEMAAALVICGAFFCGLLAGRSWYG